MVRSAPLVTGVAHHIPGGGAVLEGINGALWTLPWEVRAYILIGLLGLLTILRLFPVIVIFLSIWAWLIVDIVTAKGIGDLDAVNSGVRLLAFFFCGALFYLLRDRIPIRWFLFVASLAILVIAGVAGVWWFHKAGGLFYIVAPIPLTYAVFWLALRLPKFFRRINTRNDFSYGIYIYGTLMLNILAAVGLNQSYLAYVALNLAITFALAAASWYFIENPAMGFKNARLARVEGRLRFLRHGRPKPAKVGAGSSTDI